MFHYRIQSGPEQRIDVTTDLVTIGRSRRCKIVVDLPALEDDHCQMARRGPSWIVEDPGSRIGTFVLRDRSQPPQLCHPHQELGDNDHLLIGHAAQPLFVGWWGAVPSVAREQPCPPRAPAAKTPPARKPPGAPSERPAAPPPRAKEDSANEEVAALRRAISELHQRYRDDLRAAEELLRASEERLETSEERLETSEDRLKVSLKQIAGLEGEIQRLKDQILGDAITRAATDSDAKRRQYAELLVQVQATNAATKVAGEREIIIEQQEGKIRRLEDRVRDLDAELCNCRADLESARIALGYRPADNHQSLP
jgi:hypothetical protein